jgi:hypothetical protein
MTGAADAVVIGVPEERRPLFGPVALAEQGVGMEAKRGGETRPSLAVRAPTMPGCDGSSENPTLSPASEHVRPIGRSPLVVPVPTTPMASRAGDPIRRDRCASRIRASPASSDDTIR